MIELLLILIVLILLLGGVPVGYHFAVLGPGSASIWMVLLIALLIVLLLRVMRGP